MEMGAMPRRTLCFGCCSEPQAEDEDEEVKFEDRGADDVGELVNEGVSELLVLPGGKLI